MARLFISIVIIAVAIGVIWIRLSYSSPVAYEDHWMDSSLTQDSALSSSDALLSDRLSMPTDLQKDMPVCVLVHGFSASSFEFERFKEIVQEKGSQLLFSTVVMGGHGRDYQTFKNASYHDWIQPIADEVSRLQLLGFTNISIFAVSGGATGSLNAVLNQQITGIKRLILMDPYLIPKNKLLFWMPILKWVVPNTVSGATRDIEFMNWHINRPSQAINELRKLVLDTNKDLKNSDHQYVPSTIVFTAKHDPTSDTSAAELLTQYLPDIDVVRYESNRHVIIEPQAKLNWTDHDQLTMNTVIEQILSLFNN